MGWRRRHRRASRHHLLELLVRVALSIDLDLVEGRHDAAPDSRIGLGQLAHAEPDLRELVPAPHIDCDGVPPSIRALRARGFTGSTVTFSAPRVDCTPSLWSTAALASAPSVAALVVAVGSSWIRDVVGGVVGARVRPKRTTPSRVSLAVQAHEGIEPRIISDEDQRRGVGQCLPADSRKAVVRDDEVLGRDLQL